MSIYNYTVLYFVLTILIIRYTNETNTTNTLGTHNTIQYNFRSKNKNLSENYKNTNIFLWVYTLCYLLILCTFPTSFNYITFYCIFHFTNICKEYYMAFPFYIH